MSVYRLRLRRPHELMCVWGTQQTIGYRFSGGCASTLRPQPPTPSFIQAFKKFKIQSLRLKRLRALWQKISSTWESERPVDMAAIFTVRKDSRPMRLSSRLA